MTPYTKAWHYLQEMITTSRNTGVTRLPTIKEMAAAAQVSKETIQKAILLARKNGQITATQGKGILITQNPPSALFNPPDTPPDPDLADLIYRDLLNGRHNSRTLPLAKELMQMYGVCYATLKKALLRLVEQNLMIKRNKRYHLNRAQSHSRSQVVLIAPSDPFGTIHYFTSRMQIIIRSIEHEAYLNGVSVLVCPYDYANQRFTNPALLNPAGDAAHGVTLGYLICANTTVPDMLLPIVNSIATNALPIALFDQFNNFHPSEAFLAAHPVVRFYRIGNDHTAGKDIGSLLLNKGRLRVGCIGFSHDRDWFGDRYNGIQSVFKKAGMVDSPLRLITQEALLPRRTDQQSFACISKTIDDFLISMNPALHVTLEVKMPIHQALSSFLTQTEWLSNAPVLFEQALHTKGIDTWVCESDAMALQALAFLKDRKVRVPEEIAVMGFDDIDAALSLGLTTYNFNDMQGAKAMIGQILGMPTMPPGVREKVISIPGFVISRKTL